MHAQVGEEGRPARELQAPDLADRLAAPDDRERALVEVPERRRGPGARLGGSPWRRDGPAGSPRSPAPGAACRPGPASDAPSPITEISGCPGSGQVRVDLDPPGPVGGRPGGTGQRRRSAAPLHAGRPDDRPASIRSVAPPTSNVTPCESIAVARAPARTVTPSRPSSSATFADSFSLNADTKRSPASSTITFAWLVSMRRNWRFRSLRGERRAHRRSPRRWGHRR